MAPYHLHPLICILDTLAALASIKRLSLHSPSYLPTASLLMPSFRSLLYVVLVAVLAVGTNAEPPVDVASGNLITSSNSSTAVATGNSVAIVRSNAMVTSSDTTKVDDEKPAATAATVSQLPWDLTLLDERDTLRTAPEDAPKEQFYGYRHRFYYPNFRGGYYGWRYPLSYWNYYGRRFYGSYCPFGRIYGAYYYC